MENIKGKKVLLYSGGMDSWLIDKLWKPDVKLYVDVNSSYTQPEIDNLPDDVIIEKLNLGKWERVDKILPLRNVYFILMASNYGDEICLGATAGDRVLDKSPEFGRKMTDLLTYLYQEQHWTPERHIKVNLDFKNYTKAELIKMYLDQGGDIEEAFNQSFSCYSPTNNHECWECKPCFRKWVAFKLNGYKFDQKVNDKCINYIKTGILPQIEAGTYNRKDEEREILKALSM